jgi:hypothetical protein
MSQRKAPNQDLEVLTDEKLVSLAGGSVRVVNPQHHLWTLHERGEAFSPQIFGDFSDK